MYRKNTAGQHLGFGLVVASTGAALTGATVTAYRVVDGAAQAAATGTVTEKGNGQYDFAPSAADLNGNQVSFLFTASTAVPVEKTVVTTAGNPADANAFGLTYLDAAVSTRLATSGYTAPLDAAATRTAVGLAAASLDTQLALRTGFKLASDGLDSIAVTRPSTVAATFPQMLIQLYWRFFGKVTKTSTQIKNYAADGSTVVTTQTISDDNTTQTQGAAS